MVIGLSVPVAHADDTKSTVLFVVDTSGSMSGTPLAQAKEALHAGIDALAPGQAAGLRSFAGGCGEGGSLLVPIGTDNKDELDSAADQLSANGGTPTPDALRAAAGDLPAIGDRTIILISDGQSSCGDPCVVAAQLKTQYGIDFRVHAVGFNAPDAAESELSCIAAATGGQYFTATNTTELSSAISTAITSGGGDIRPDIVCTAPTFIGVRGSSEQPQSPDLAYYKASAAANKPFNKEGTVNLGMGGPLREVFNFLQRQPSVDYDFNVMSVAYPAIEVTASADYIFGDYRDSVQIGADNLTRIMKALSAKCKGETRVVLAGYSQGANVINRYLVDNGTSEDAKSVKSVLYLGDPNAQPKRGGERHEGTAFNYLGVVAGGVTNGDADITAYLSTHPNVVSSFCLTGDIVCNPPVDVVFGKQIHGSYGLPTTKASCPVNGEKDVVVFQCAAFRVMKDTGYALPAVVREPTLVQRGQQILFSIGGWLAKQPSLALFASEPTVIGNFTTDDNGNAVVSVNVPMDAPNGDHHLIVRQPGGRSVEVPVTVVDSTDTTNSPVYSFGPEDGTAPTTGSGGTGSSAGPSGGFGSLLPFGTGSSGN
ncbi:hypothetical protein CH281_23335 [Rhodococcus sp. 06-221-2]|uniref:cutinase family protein n=1 Tax=Rhodococcus sp. 06-221-2 TaxID=2022514 RepID=UPI000B9C6DF3|nr:cutinase family protein [Rhodococcus sp. 06-221-2]OZC96794.1 hypothetical protein CH281_23335 [Rhodococcus sp. 06-221-2]